MSRVNNNKISDEEISELKNLALAKKSRIKYRTMPSSINGDYKVKVGGIGNKTIKLEIFLEYETILANKTAGGLEETIYNKLMELPKYGTNTKLGKQ